jgi:hypothetical protein
MAPAGGILTITGQDIDPGAHPLVTFSDGKSYSVTVPSVLSSTNTLLVAAPIYFDALGNESSGTVSIQVTQTPSTGTPVVSNKLSGLTIQAPLASALPPGYLLAAFLNAAIQHATSLKENLVGTSLDSPASQATLDKQIATLNATLLQVQSVADGTSQSFIVGQVKNADLYVGRADLIHAEKVLIGVLSTFAGPEPDLSKFGSITALGFANVQSSSSLNPIQAAAQAALDAALNSVTTPAGLNNAVANWIASFVKSDPALATKYAVVGSGVLASILAVQILGLPEALVAAWVTLYPGADILLSDFVMTDAIKVIASAVLAQCLDGVSPAVAVKDFFSGVVTTLLSEVGGGVAGDMLLLKDALTWVRNGFKCSPPGMFTVNINVIDVIGGRQDSAVQVCADLGANRSVCGPYGGFAFGTDNTIDVTATKGQAYNVVIPANQPVSPYCSVTSGGSSEFGPAMPTAVVTCN